MEKIEIRLKEFRIRLVEEEDAAFIVELRTNEALAKYLHATSPDVEKQKSWIRAYKQREQQGHEYYFISETYNGEKLGLNRLYDFKGDSFELGSWIFKKGLVESASVLADIAVRDFAFEKLGFRVCRFNVRKENKAVIRYHQLFKPTLVAEDALDNFYELDYATYQMNRPKILKLMNHGS